jgi:hypothetical protein
MRRLDSMHPTVKALVKQEATFVGSRVRIQTSYFFRPHSLTTNSKLRALVKAIFLPFGAWVVCVRECRLHGARVAAGSVFSFSIHKFGESKCIGHRWSIYLAGMQFIPN